MARSLWTGAISFGLVNIPVKLYSAVKDSSLNLDMLDEKDHSNIRFKRVNENTGKEVPYEHIVKGYKVNDEYVILDPEDFERADAKKTKTIEMLNFVDEEEIDSMYYEQPYYLEPDKSGEKAYGVLRDALAASGRVGVTMFVLRNKEILAILKPYKKVIVLNRIRFQEEIRDTEDIDVPPVVKAKSKELEMAAKLIDQLTEHFDISAYGDTYTAALLKIIKEKSKKGSGKKKVPVKHLRIVHTKNSDLINALQASLKQRKSKAG